PTGAAAATVSLTSSNPSVGSTPVVNASNIGTTFTVDAGGGTDTLTVNGTQNGETITVSGALVTVGALKTVNYLGSENLAVNGRAGNATFNGHPYRPTRMFNGGGHPVCVPRGKRRAM